MKNSLIKACGILLVAVMLVTSLTSCSAGRPIKSTEEELAVVGTVGNFEVLYEELRCVTLLYRDQLANKYGDGIWSDPALTEQYRPELYELVSRNITANYAVLSLCAEVGISPDAEEIQNAVTEYINELVDEIGGRSEYKKALEQQNITDHFMRFTISVDYCQNELFYSYTEDLALIETDYEKIYDYIMDGNFVRTLHVYIQNDAGDDIEKNRAAAQDVVERLRDGEDIKKIIGSSVNEDFDLTTTDGYYFGRGEMIQAYEDAAFALDVNGISDVIETSTGFYVIQRFPLETAYVMQNLTTLTEQYQYSELNSYIDERQAELTFEFNDYGNTIDLTKIS
ncbi:MAG: peptidylprolyl isomerase [Clostridia bacterium]|nr:peptidylprolyl isomerase [Clostridia bacterium]